MHAITCLNTPFEVEGLHVHVCTCTLICRHVHTCACVCIHACIHMHVYVSWPEFPLLPHHVCAYMRSEQDNILYRSIILHKSQKVRHACVTMYRQRCISVWQQYSMKTKYNMIFP